MAGMGTDIYVLSSPCKRQLSLMLSHIELESIYSHFITYLYIICVYITVICVSWRDLVWGWKPNRRFGEV
ncbi:hypothetical protein BDQ94DRAFT_155590 [Aspergillus welwitschiae]|uniref:Uncharacterized protein n=1 Tax=Aspergillus welwitschiae TaxID=1341132 RepID=A0A3F3PI16_9EURO|nr:hypothetical protein BDQ94DRAFT_155590 [Aspergillus welwitschiae]RDH26403.1 hypothetical protein BDQ94DRAFT_155590 [Aspergillus welwitschiae]